MHIAFVRAVCSKENACALGDFTGPLVHSNIKRAHSRLHIFSTSIAGSKVERYTETAEQMVWICRVLLLYVLPSHFAFIINQCEFESLGSRDCLFSSMCVDCASFFILPLSRIVVQHDLSHRSSCIFLEGTGSWKETIILAGLYHVSKLVASCKVHSVPSLNI